jgi:hypothetical protein
MKIIIFGIIAILLVGCRSTGSNLNSTGVVKRPNGKFSISKETHSSRVSVDTLKKELKVTATQFCNESGKKMELILENGSGSWAEIAFKCE